MTEAAVPAGQRSGAVALVGWTNVGKSTLLNRLVGTKLAAVADTPQTTRNRITGVRTLPGQGQVVFVDTPGFHRGRHRINRAMHRIARDTLGAVDLVLQVLDAARGLGPGDAQIARLLRASGTRRLAALNKIDLVEPRARLLPMMDTAVSDWGFPEVFAVSARTGEECDRLVEHVLGLLPGGPALFGEDFVTDQPERRLAAEWIREQLLRHAREELPHATAVVVERWNEHDGALTIDATIYVERKGQKAIVIGRGGQLLKRVGTEARQELERWRGAPVHLRLWVKLRPDWRDDPRVLAELGLR
jgi:GTP-binding protein Era